MSADRQRYDRLSELFSEARKLSSSDRPAFLAKACEGDSELRQEVEDLLAADQRDDLPDHLLADEMVEGARGRLQGVLAESTATPERIGTYRILSVIGAGGMGLVYQAEQDNPQRRVALKVVAPEMSSPDRVRRLRREATLLGRLRHPAIAQVYEAGSFDVGRGEQPFFAMEFVDGPNLLHYTEREHLDVRGKFSLLAEICDGVQHAHEQGIVHRDLKPDNILVDPHGRPKILDFGVARASDTAAVMASMLTTEGQIVGTLAYSAPEQLTGQNDQITPRTDVYALGTIAFELVCGRRPHDLESLSITAAIKLVSTESAPRLGVLDEKWRGDVETIIGKALEREPRRRYESAAALAADLRRWLDHRPIAARPPSRLYRARKFAQRHRGLVFGFATATVVLVAGLVLTGAFAVQLKEREQRIERSEWRLVGSQLAGVRTALGEGERWRAAELLYQVPEERRGWEWHMVAATTPRPLEGLTSARMYTFVVAAPPFAVVLEGDQLRAWTLEGKPLPDPTPELRISASTETNYGKHVAVATLSGELRIVDLVSGQSVPVQPEARKTERNTLAIDRDGSTVARLSETHLEVWRDGQHRQLPIGDLRSKGQPYGEQIFISPDGSLLLYHNDYGYVNHDYAIELGVWFGSDEPAVVKPARAGESLAFHPERREYVLCDSVALQVFDWTFQKTKTLANQSWCNLARYPANGSTLFASDKDHLRVYDAETGDERASFLHGRARRVHGANFAVAPDGSKILVNGPEFTHPWMLVDVQVQPNAPALEVGGHSSPVFQLAISRDGELVASGAPQEEVIRIWSSHTGEEIAQLQRGVGPTEEYWLTFDAEDQQLIVPSVSEHGNKMVHIWNRSSKEQETRELAAGRSTLEELGRRCGPGDATAVRLNASTVLLPGRGFALAAGGTGNANSTVRLLGAGERDLPPMPEGSFTCVAVDVEGDLLACGRRDGVSIFDFETATLVAQPDVRAIVLCAEFSPDRSRLALGCDDGRVFLLETRFFEVVLSFQAHLQRENDLSAVQAIAWTPDGARLLTASGSGSVRVWTGMPPTGR